MVGSARKKKGCSFIIAPCFCNLSCSRKLGWSRSNAWWFGKLLQNSTSWSLCVCVCVWKGVWGERGCRTCRTADRPPRPWTQSGLQRHHPLISHTVDLLDITPTCTIFILIQANFTVYPLGYFYWWYILSICFNHLANYWRVFVVLSG